MVCFMGRYRDAGGSGDAITLTGLAFLTGIFIAIF